MACAHRERVLPKRLVYWTISVDTKTGVAHKLLMATNQIVSGSVGQRRDLVLVLLFPSQF